MLLSVKCEIVITTEFTQPKLLGYHVAVAHSYCYELLIPVTPLDDVDNQ